MVGAGAVETLDGTVDRAWRTWIGREHDGLIAADRSAVCRPGVVAHRLQLLADRPEQLRFEIENVWHLSVMEACHVRCRLNVGSKIEDVDENLRDALGLHVAAHQGDRHQRPVVLHDKAGRQCIEWALVRRYYVRALRIQREKRTPVVQDETVAGNSNTRTKTAVVAVDP